MATNLFNLLISNDVPTIEESVPSHEQWDSSTVSSSLDGDSVIENGMSVGTYYKSASRFAVRLWLFLGCHQGYYIIIELWDITELQMK